MFAMNDCVFYDTTGVCRIVDIRTERLGGSEAQEYYVLKPIYNQNSITYVCTSDADLLAKMRPILTKEEVHALIQAMPTEEEIWIRDDRDRDREYGARLRTGDSHELMKIIKTLYLEKERKKGTGKRLTTMDTRIMATAEKLLHEEFALVLDIDPKDVVPFISSHLS